MATPVVYIVDNDLISAFDIKIRIHQSGMPCRVRSFDDAETALERLRTEFESGDGWPDVLLISFDLPRMDGPALLDGLESNGMDFEHTDVYVFSAFGLSADQKNACGERIKGFFTKPLSMAEIREIFGRSRSTNQGSEVSA